VVSAEATQQELEALALADPRVIELTAGKQIVKTIIVPGRLVNFVVK
jgi:leucyl-tRNA synthetase